MGRFTLPLRYVTISVTGDWPQFKMMANVNFCPVWTIVQLRVLSRLDADHAAHCHLAFFIHPLVKKGQQYRISGGSTGNSGGLRASNRSLLSLVDKPIF